MSYRATKTGVLIETFGDGVRAVKNYAALYNLAPGFVRVSEFLFTMAPDGTEWTWTKYDEKQGVFVHYKKGL